MFSIGDTVCYPLHGVGKIIAIEDKEVCGRSSTYYVIQSVTQKMTILLPIETAESAGLRSVVSPDMYPKFLEYYKTAEVNIGDSNWNQRYRENMAKLRSGDLFSVIDVILCLTKRNSMRTLSSQERKMLLNARSVLSSELAESTGKSEQEIESAFIR